jgi:CheY-like chemotaxis protein
MLSRGGTFLCDVCRARVLIPTRQAAIAGGTGGGAARSAAAIAMPSPVPVVSETKTALESESASNPQIPADSSEVTCPHCGGSFLARIASEHPDPAASPSGPRAGAAASPQAPLPPVPRLRTVLIVEDSEFFRECAVDALKTGYRPLKARNASEALGILNRERVDLVILDLTLEREEDGLEVLAATAAKNLPCLIFTARNEAEMWVDGWQRLQKLGATDLLIKSVNAEEQLLAKVATILDQAPVAGR